MVGLYTLGMLMAGFMPSTNIERGRAFGATAGTSGVKDCTSSSAASPGSGGLYVAGRMMVGGKFLIKSLTLPDERLLNELPESDVTSRCDAADDSDVSEPEES